MDDALIHPEIWPDVAAPDLRDDAVEARIEQILQEMTLEEKVGQVIQADISAVTPEDLRTYRLGSILNGGNSAPGGDNHVDPSAYLALADAFYDVSVNPEGGAAAIPVIWGTDAVHGHNNIVGATIFPHNVGLGAAHDRDLVREIGAATALEVQATGMDWAFAPTLAVVRDDRWGRTYESYSEDPEIVRLYADAMVEGLQGRPGTEEFLGSDHVIATAKHFLGDGGTEDGHDQGDNSGAEEELRDIHGAGYVTAIEGGVQTVMASFSSWRGQKMHGSQDLLQKVLFDRMNFDGFVVGDWNGHGQVEGCTNVSCPASFNAGVDMLMAPDTWKELYANTLAQVTSGEIPVDRLDEAVRRILRVKIRYGVFERGRPSSRPRAGDFSLLGTAAHRDVARRAVRQSLVLLKNNNGLLPLDPTARILVAGDGADNVAKQSGGWSLTWQGEGNTNDDFPNGQSIFGGLQVAIESAGGTAVLSESGAYEEKPDAAIVVFGENPYAEFQGDRKNLDFTDEAALEILRRLKADGVPVVSVFLSGRPLYVNPELNASDAFVAAWLPGTEGGGVADVLLRTADGSINHDFTGKLSFSWPRTPTQTPLNRGDDEYDPLFSYGYGLTHEDDGFLAQLDESEVCEVDDSGEFMRAGRVRRPYRMRIESGGEIAAVSGPMATVNGGQLKIRSVDRLAQEDARELVWSGPGVFAIDAEGLNLTPHAGARMALSFSYAVMRAPSAAVRAGLQCAQECEGMNDLTAAFQQEADGEWRRLDLPLGAMRAGPEGLGHVTVPFTIESDGAFKIRISDVRIGMPGGARGCE